MRVSPLSCLRRARQLCRESYRHKRQERSLAASLVLSRGENTAFLTSFELETPHTFFCQSMLLSLLGLLSIFLHAVHDLLPVLVFFYSSISSSSLLCPFSRRLRNSRRRPANSPRSHVEVTGQKREWCWEVFSYGPIPFLAAFLGLVETTNVSLLVVVSFQNPRALAGASNLNNEND